jgi:hypothetical protein
MRHACHWQSATTGKALIEHGRKLEFFRNRGERVRTPKTLSWVKFSRSYGTLFEGRVPRVHASVRRPIMDSSNAFLKEWKQWMGFPRISCWT